jgi:zinc transporter ZupT
MIPDLRCTAGALHHVPEKLAIGITNFAQNKQEAYRD